MKREEDKLQAEMVAWFRAEYPDRSCDLFHVPNEAKRNPVEAGRQAALGLIPGVPDLMLHLGLNKFLPIEVKTQKGRASKAQENLAKLWALKSTDIVVVRSLDDFKRVCRALVGKIKAE